MNPKVSIRKVCGIKEKETIRDLHLKCFDCDEPCSTSTGHWWIAYDSKRTPIAFAGIEQSYQWSDTGYLCRSGVIPQARGAGLQKKLIRVRLSFAKRYGWNYVITDTAKDNVASSNSLISCGFRLYNPSYKWGFKSGNYWRKSTSV